MYFETKTLALQKCFLKIERKKHFKANSKTCETLSKKQQN